MPGAGRDRSYRHELCRVCETRKAKYVNGCCLKCNALLEAEGTHELHGVAAESAVRQRWRVQAAEYNRLIRARHSQAQIAQMWGMKLSSLRSFVWRWKTLAGIKMVPALGNRRGNAEIKPASATTKKRRRVNDHGGGKWGVKDCKCDPCMKVRSVSRVAANKTYRDGKKLRKQQETAAAEKKNVT